MKHEEINKIKEELGYDPFTFRGRLKYLWKKELSRELFAGLVCANILLYFFILPNQRRPQSPSELEQRTEVRKIQEVEPQKYNPFPYPNDGDPHHFYFKTEGLE